MQEWKFFTDYMFWQITDVHDGTFTSVNVCNIFPKKKKKKKKKYFKAEPLMFLDLASRMKSLYSDSEQYCIK